MNSNLLELFSSTPDNLFDKGKKRGARVRFPKNICTLCTQNIELPAQIAYVQMIIEKPQNRRG
jgi:hypothetical protein